MLGVLISRRRQDRRDPLRAAVVLWSGWWLVLAVFFSVGTYLNSYYVAALVPAVAALCGAGIAACGSRPWPARVRLILAATVLGCVGYGACLVSGTVTARLGLTAVALVAVAAAIGQLLMAVAGKGGHRTALGSPALTRGVQRTELAKPPGDALLGADTSGLAQDYILYSGREVLPIGGYLGNVPAPTLTTLRSDISRGFVRLFVLPVSPPSPDPRVRWLESNCIEVSRGRSGRPVQLATFLCGHGGAQPSTQQAPASLPG